jgi:hypothetical protein
MKTKQLSKDDACIVDLLMEQPVSPGSGMSSCFTHAASAEVAERLVRAESLFKKLDEYKVADPDESLVARTLERCEGRAAAMTSNPHPPMDPLTVS